MRRAEMEETIETFEAGYEEIGEVLENRKLKKEMEQLYAMLGKATALMQRPKG